MAPALAAGAAALLAWLLLPGSRWAVAERGLAAVASRPDPVTTPDRVRAWAPLWCGCAALAVVAFLDGPFRWPAAALAATALWVLVRRSEPAAARRRREELRRELPAFVEIYAAALACGAPIGGALEIVREALPGPVAGELSTTSARLALGVDPVSVWTRLGDDCPPLGPFGRVMMRAYGSGASVTASVQDLADQLAERDRGEVEDRARAVGVRAAVPLGLCLLPAFLLLGIVPLVAAAVQGLGW